MLKWLVEELQKAEDNDELVHIIGHIPTLHEECYDQWAQQYDKIISR